MMSVHGALLAAVVVVDERGQADDGQRGDREMREVAAMQLMRAEDFDSVLPVPAIVERVAAGMPFGVHLVAETPPGLAPHLALAVPVRAAAAAGRFFGLFGLRAAFFVDREFFSHADA
jgi:hypothetical protein